MAKKKVMKINLWTFTVLAVATTIMLASLAIGGMSLAKMSFTDYEVAQQKPAIQIK